MLDRVLTLKRIKALKCFFEGIRLDLVLNGIFICKPLIVKQHSSDVIFLFLSNYCFNKKYVTYFITMEYE